jgi:hypothetical protein
MMRMAGPTGRIDYVSDDGHTYNLNNPVWQNAVAGNVTGTTGTGSLAKGGRARYRMMLNTGTGREFKVRFAAVTLANWTAVNGTSITYTRGEDGPPDGTYVWGGRIGERALYKH